MGDSTPLHVYEAKRQQIRERMEILGFPEEYTRIILATVRPGNVDGLLETLEQWIKEGKPQ